MPWGCTPDSTFISVDLPAPFSPQIAWIAPRRTLNETSCVTVSLDGVRMAGSDPETVLQALVFSATAADVRSVIVDGVEIVRDGRHGIDPSALHEAVRAVTGLSGR